MVINKKKILVYSGLANIIILIVILINIIIVFPLTAENAWIYGIYIMAAGFVAYFTGLYLIEGYRLELIGTITTVVGEIFLIAYLSILFRIFWISAFIVLPIMSFCAMMLIAYYYTRKELETREAYNISIMLISGVLFFFMVEAAIRVPEAFQAVNMPIWGIIIIIGGLILYAFTTWKIIEKPSYITALAGAFIVNIGVLIIELYYRLHEITRIFTIIFLLPGLIFFLLIFLNYKISPYE